MLFGKHLTMMEYLESIDRWLVLVINGWNTPALDKFFWLISGKLIWIPIYLFVIFKAQQVIGWKFTLAFLGTTIFAVVISDQVCTHLFKEVFLRYRPSHNELIQDKLHYYKIKPGEWYRGGQYGFISSHAANFGAMAIMIYNLFVRSRYFLKWLLPLIVGLVALSRVYLGVHYISDVLVGAFVGGLIAQILFHFVFKRITQQTPQRL
jgi:undecaprenyl-diphosphatase